MKIWVAFCIKYTSLIEIGIFERVSSVLILILSGFGGVTRVPNNF
jgi:hypothetical protein